MREADRQCLDIEVISETDINEWDFTAVMPDAVNTWIDFIRTLESRLRPRKPEKANKHNRHRVKP